MGLCKIISFYVWAFIMRTCQRVKCSNVLPPSEQQRKPFKYRINKQYTTEMKERGTVDEGE